MSPSSDIPFDKLVLSQSNVRRIKSGTSIEELAEDIARRGLLQSLNVRPVLDDDGAETGRFEIPAGGRRFQALSLLVKQKRLAKTAPIPCIVRDAHSSILAEDDSLAENMQRVALHPLDQFRAFADLQAKGQGEEEIAAAFFVTPTVVKQRLRLASVAPALLEVYAQDGMTLEQMMAFTVNGDHARQAQVWEAVKNSWNREPHIIRRMLTETSVRADERRAVFVGADAFQAAGGSILRDLFQEAHEGWFEDPALLDSLVSEKLQAEADVIRAEGWKWVEVALDLPYGYHHGLRRLVSTPALMTDDEEARHTILLAKYQALEAEYSEVNEYPEEVDARLGELNAAMEAIHVRPEVFDQGEIGRAGVFLTLDRDGAAVVYRGFVRPADEAPVSVEGEETTRVDVQGETDHQVNQSFSNRGAGTESAAQLGNEPEGDDEDGLKPLSERLLIELTAHRSVALRDAVGRSPRVALTLLLHKLVQDVFRTGQRGGCLEASVREVYFGSQAMGLNDSPSAKAVDERHAAWTADLPLQASSAALWDHLSALDDASRMALLAHCLSFGINALHERPNTYGGNGVSPNGLVMRMAQADRVAEETGLDMVEAGWQPTVENYLGRVPKARILEAVREAKGEGAAQLIDHLKKGEMAQEAQRLLAGSFWLPEALRAARVDDASVAAPLEVADTAGQGGGVEEIELPAYLTEGLGDVETSILMAAE